MTNLKLVSADQLTFNYDLVAAPVALQAREAAERIKLRLRRSAEDIIEIGRDLLAVKEALPHGSFLPWIEAEFGMSDRTANRFMDVGRAYGAKSATVADLPPTALYELAAPKTPIEVREEIEKMIEAGEVVTKATIIELRRKLDETSKAAEQAAETIETLAARNAELAIKIQAPIAPPDLDLDAIRAEGAREAEARLTGRINDLAAANVKATAEAKTLSDEVQKLRTSNVVQPEFTAPGDDEEDVPDQESAIHAFSGAIGAMDGLEFSPSTFWKQQGRTGTHGKRIYKALLSVNAAIGLLIKEYSK